MNTDTPQNIQPQDSIEQQQVSPAPLDRQVIQPTVIAPTAPVVLSAMQPDQAGTVSVGVSSQVLQPVAPEASLQRATPLQPQQPFVAQAPVVTVAPVAAITYAAPYAQAQPFPTAENTAFKSSNGLKYALAAIAGVFILGGAGAAAYFGLVLPNKPENVLKAAFANMLDADSTAYDASLVGEYDYGQGDTQKLNFSAIGGVNTAQKQLDSSVKFDFLGAPISFDVRYVGGDTYFKLGDLTDFAKSLSSMYGDYGVSTADLSATYGKLTERWVKVDKKTMQDGDLDCLINSDWKLTKEDVSIMNAAYDETQPVTIEKLTNVNLGGSSTKKFDLLISSKASQVFFKKLEAMPSIKKAKECSDKLNSREVSSITGDVSKVKTDTAYRLSLWVNGNKNIVKIAASDEKTEDSMTTKGTLNVGLVQKPVTVAVPENPMTIEEFQQMFSGLDGVVSRISNSKSNSVASAKKAGTALAGLEASKRAQANEAVLLPKQLVQSIGRPDGATLLKSILTTRK